MAEVRPTPETARRREKPGARPAIKGSGGGIQEWQRVRPVRPEGNDKKTIAPTTSPDSGNEQLSGIFLERSEAKVSESTSSGP